MTHLDYKDDKDLNWSYNFEKIYLDLIVSQFDTTKWKFFTFTFAKKLRGTHHEWLNLNFCQLSF